jgi:enamine deaminase RidA (YjgF/YER057c/UK114 family)
MNYSIPVSHEHKEDLLKKYSNDTIKRSFAGATYTFGIISCESNKTDILKKIITPLEDAISNKKHYILKIAGFVNNITDQKLISDCLREFIKPLPPITITVQAPLDKNDIQVLYWLIESTNNFKINYRTDGLIDFQQKSLRFVHIGDLRFETTQYENCQSKEEWLFSYWEYLDSMLNKVNFSGDDIIRLWLYINDITEQENGIENYQLANRVRSKYFERHKFFKTLKLDYNAFPASTGIGTKDTTLAMHCIALRPLNKDVYITPLENPHQYHTVDYNEKHGPYPPKFSRGAAVIYQKKGFIFVSGTASIVKSETVFVENPEKQCKQTLQNIDELLSKKNLIRYGIRASEEGLNSLAYVKIYLKKRNHFSIIKKVCKNYLPDIPMLFLEADICRSELLVEIEGISFPEARVIQNDK